MKSIARALVRVLICIGAVAAIFGVLFIVQAKAVIPALVLLLAVLIASTAWGLPYALLLSGLAALALSWFLTPQGQFRVADQRTLIALITFLITGTTASRLADRARREARKAHQRRDEAFAAQQRFTDLVNSVEGIVWEADATTFQLSFVNKQAERILGYPVERWLSEPSFWRDHLHPDDRSWVEAYCVKAIAERRPRDLEYRMVAADGRVVWLRDIVTVVEEGERAVRLRGVMVDTTEHRRADEALRQAQADLARISRATTIGELTASLAHEINQPIAAALTNANTCGRWLARDPPDIKQARQAISRTEEDVMRAAEIISRVRSLFSNRAPKRELIDLNEIIREMIPLLGSEASRYSISLLTDLDPDLPEAMADRVQLQQVIMNLALNGMEAMREANGVRELTIKSTRGAADQLMVSVSDTGIGLPSGQLDQIFKAFFTTKPQGTGMGLSISKSIVEAHGGALRAAANAGPGATFSFSVPSKVG